MGFLCISVVKIICDFKGTYSSKKLVKLYIKFTNACYVISGGIDTLPEVIKELFLLPHLAAILLQLPSFRMVIKERYRDRMTIGLVFFSLILISFMSASFAIDVVVLFSLSIALIVRGNALKNNTYRYIGFAMFALLFTWIVYFIYELI